MKKSYVEWGVAVAAMLAVTGAQAQLSGVDWGGYFRAGPSATARSGANTGCYTLGGNAGMKYRLGNECDFYGEFALSKTGKAEGIEYKVLAMTNLHNGGGASDTEGKSVGINQLYVQGKGFDFAPDVTFWVGKRFYERTEVYVIDTKFTQLDGVGGGAIVPVGPGKLGVSFFRNDTSGTTGTGTGSTDRPGSRINLDYSGLPVNPGGTLHFVFGSVQGTFDGGTSGQSYTVLHEQEKFLGLGGKNSFWVQYANGAAGLNGNFGSLTAATAAKGFRVAESFTWQVGAFGGQAIAMWEQDKDALGNKTALQSIGGRMSYALTRNFKLLGEAGYMTKKPDGAPEAKLTKLTFAPTVSIGPGFFDRPELRAYVTTARWNDAAGNVTGKAAFAGRTRGTSYGLQVEMWF